MSFSSDKEAVPSYLNTDGISSELELLDAAVEASSSADPLQGRVLELGVHSADPTELPDVQGLEGSAALSGHSLPAVQG